MILNLCGGGWGTNLTVVGGTTAPTSPAKNTIWVNTSVSFTSWALASTDPDYLGSDGVWIQTGTSSPAAFNISAGDNRVYLYPIGVKQWDSANSAWINRDAKLWDGNAWIDLLQFLYNAGDECTAVTGGWQAYAVPVSSDNTGANPNVTRNSDSLYMVGNIYTSGIVRTANKISFSDVDRIVLDATTKTISSDDGSLYSMMRFCLWSDMGATFEDNAVFVEWIGGVSMNGEYSFDVSAVPDGQYYVGFAFYSTSADGSSPAITLRSMRLD